MLSAFIVYLAGHFAAYVLWLRKLRRFRSEKAIFLYHLLPAVVVGLAGSALIIRGSQEFDLPSLVLVVSIHGIYSISFLELWSLAQGGYSLSIIEHTIHSTGASLQPDMAHLAEIGRRKQNDRLAGLEKMGVITRRNGLVFLTRRGRCVAYVLHALRRWVHPAEPD